MKALKDKSWDNSGKGDWQLEYDDVKEAVLTFKKEMYKRAERGHPKYKSYFDDIMELYKKVFGDFK